jgi:hypothetical protein
MQTIAELLDSSYYGAMTTTQTQHCECDSLSCSHGDELSCASTTDLRQFNFCGQTRTLCPVCAADARQFCEDFVYPFRQLALSLLIGCVLALTGHAEQLPSAPVPQMPIVDRTLLAGVLAVRIEDAASTSYMHSIGGRETVLPGFIAYHPAAMTAYGCGIFYLQYRASKSLIAHGHPRLARISEIVHVAATGYAASRNWTLEAPGHSTKGTRFQLTGSEATR